MNVGVDAVFLHEVAKDVGVGGGYLLAVEPFQTGIVDLLRDGKAQATLAEAQTIDNLSVLATLYKFVLANDTDIGYS